METLYPFLVFINTCYIVITDNNLDRWWMFEKSIVSFSCLLDKFIFCYIFNNHGSMLGEADACGIYRER
jgi:hypothetical protein